MEQEIINNLENIAKSLNAVFVVLLFILLFKSCGGKQ